MVQKFWPLLVLIAVGLIALVLIGLDTGGSSGTKKQDSGLEFEDEKVGTATEAKPGDRVTVHYTGWLANGGKMFDSSKNRGREPFQFTLVAGEVIKGWDEGVVGMKVGGKRKLMIPSKLAYGPRARAPIFLLTPIWCSRWNC